MERSAKDVTGRDVRLPLRARDGSIRGYALVDAEDHARVGSHRWNLHPKGYVYRNAPRDGGPRRKVWLHREILGLVLFDGLQGDHINGDRQDNHRSNLRITTNAQNHQNLRPESRQGAVSRFRGVKRAGRRWIAEVTVAGRVHNLGRFDVQEDAARAAAEGRARLMPYSARERAAEDRLLGVI